MHRKLPWWSYVLFVLGEGVGPPEFLLPEDACAIAYGQHSRPPPGETRREVV
jgi:hypothetical protein